MRRLAALALLALLALAGCGADEDQARPNESATLLLDFTPNAVHTGIYSAITRGYDTAEGVKLRVRAPGSSSDAVKLLLAERTDFAVLDIHDLAIARAQGRDIVGVMSIAQRPLAAVIAQPGTRTPRALEGKRVGVTGLPSDEAVLRSILEGAGANPDGVTTTTIGFNAVPALLGGRVDAVTAFWNVEGLALRARRPGIREFRVERFGAPSYPELVLCVARTTLQDSPGLVDSVRAALRRGYEQTVADPESATESLVEADSALRRSTVSRQLDAVSPAFTAGVDRFGELDRTRLEAWARWERRFGIVDHTVDVTQAFSFE
jgi:putative hydroxymethylpyrimidine transport system substrate-binding protein